MSKKSGNKSKPNKSQEGKKMKPRTSKAKVVNRPVHASGPLAVAGEGPRKPCTPAGD